MIFFSTSQYLLDPRMAVELAKYSVIALEFPFCRNLCWLSM